MRYGFDYYLRLFSLFLLLTFTNNTFGSSAKVNKIWLEYGTRNAGEKGMTIHADISVNGMKGSKIKVIAYYYDSEKNKLMGGVSGYKTKDGQVSVSDYVTPSYDSSQYKDFVIFIPYSAIPFSSGEHDYYVKIRVLDAITKKFISSNESYKGFTGTGNSGNRNIDRNRNYSQRGNSLEYADLLDQYSKYDRIPIDCGILVNTSKWLDNPNSGTHGLKIYKFLYDSGWEKQLQISTCLNCLGDGKCHNICRYQSGLATSNTFPCECEFVGKRGECVHCNGTGIAIAITAINNDTDYAYDAQGHIQLLRGGGSSSGAYNSSSSSSDAGNSSHSSNNSLYKTCHVCNGTGRCTSCKGGGTVFVTGGGTNYHECSSCLGSGKCFMCHGRGKI